MILEFMRDDHRACDHLYTDAENALAAKNTEEAKRLFGEFYRATNHHFDMEERELFVTFEKRTGMVGGPTQMMRFEHQQLRAQLEAMQKALNDNNTDDFFGIGESMMIMLQQHNMKEEQMLYPMIDRVLEGGMILLDTRGLEHPVPLEMAFGAFTRLQGHEILHMIHTREPLPLFELVASNGGCHYSYQDDDGFWHILITHDTSIDLENCRV